MKSVKIILKEDVVRLSFSFTLYFSTWNSFIWRVSIFFKFKSLPPLKYEVFAQKAPRLRKNEPQGEVLAFGNWDLFIKIIRYDKSMFCEGRQFESANIVYSIQLS